MPCTGPAETNSGGKICKSLLTWISYCATRLPPLSNPDPQPYSVTPIGTVFPSLSVEGNPQLPEYNRNIPPVYPNTPAAARSAILRIRVVLTRSAVQVRTRPVTFSGHNFSIAEKNILSYVIRSFPAYDQSRISLEDNGINQVYNTLALRQKLSVWISQN